MPSSRAWVAVDAFGVTRKRYAATIKKIRILAVEPSESPVLSGGKPGSHKLTESERVL